MNYSTEDDLSAILKAHFSYAFYEQNVNTFVIFSDNQTSLFFQVKSLTLKPYVNETSISGKAIRILLYLHKDYHLLKVLEEYGIDKVIVTEASNPGNSTKANTEIMEARFVKVLLATIETLQNSSNSGVIDEYINMTINSLKW